MKHDLLPHIEKDLITVSKAFIDIGWKREQFDAVSLKTPVDVFLVFAPELMYFWTKDREKARTVWIACIYQNTLSESELRDVGEFLKSEVAKLPWRPFKDEDAFLQMFRRRRDRRGRKWSDLVFYLNPDFPKGIWVNHALG